MNNGTMNVTPITDKQPQPSCRFTIQATLRGFPITIEGEGRAGDLKLIVERLLQSGAEPPAANVKAPATATEDAPICEFHGKMKKGNYGWFCPKKMGDGSYCKSKA
jgi:hypothetical protein